MKAFDRAKGAKKQYALSCGFLRQLIPVMKRMQIQLTESQDEQLQSDLGQQFEAINVAYEDFDNYLAKKYNGLSAKEPSRASQILTTIRWTLDELNEKVQKFKDRINDALQVYQAMMLQEIFNKVDSLESIVQSNSSEDQMRFEETASTMKAVQEQLTMYQEFEKDTLEYKQYLWEDVKQQQNDNTSAIRGDLAEMRTEMKANHEEQMRAAEAEAESQEESRSELMKCQQTIVGLIERQQQMAKSQDEEAKWSRIQLQAQEEAQANESAQKAFTDNLSNTSEGLTLVNDKVGNEHVRKGLDEVNYVTKWAGFLGKTGFLNTKNGSGKKEQQPSTVTRPNANNTTPRARPTTVLPPPSAPQRPTASPTSSPPPVSSNRYGAAPPPPPRSPASSAQRSMARPPPPSRMTSAPAKTLRNPWGLPVQPSTPPSPPKTDTRRDSGLGSNEPEVRPPLPARPGSEAILPPPLPPRFSNSPSKDMAEIVQVPQAAPMRSPPTLKPKPKTLTASPTLTPSATASLAAQSPKPDTLRRTVTSPPGNTASVLRSEGANDFSHRELIERPSDLRVPHGDVERASVKQRAMMFEMGGV